MTQLILPGLFETVAPLPVRAPIPRPRPHVIPAPSTILAPSINWTALDEYALLYTATETGTNSGVRFMMTVEDAQRWCESPESRGFTHGTEWAYFWTRVSNFMRRNDPYEQPGDTLTLARAFDNGSWDERIANAGCVKIDLDDIAGILRPLGVKVVRI